MVPVLGVEAFAGEGVDAFDVGVCRGAKAAHAGNHNIRLEGAEFGQALVFAVEFVAGVQALVLHVGPEFGAVAGFDGPALGFFVKAGTRHVGVQAHVFHEVVFFGAASQVGLDFFLLGEHAGPIGVLFEREGVESGLDVAGAAGVVIFVPGAADVIAFFQDDEVVVSGFFEFDAHAQAGEPGADDDDFCGLAHIIHLVVRWPSGLAGCCLFRHDDWR